MFPLARLLSLAAASALVTFQLTLPLAPKSYLKILVRLDPTRPFSRQLAISLFWLSLRQTVGTAHSRPWSGILQTSTLTPRRALAPI